MDPVAEAKPRLSEVDLARLSILGELNATSPETTATAYRINFRSKVLPYDADGSGSLDRLVTAGLLERIGEPVRCGLSEPSHPPLAQYYLTKKGVLLIHK